jgi:uncharacterized protein
LTLYLDTSALLKLYVEEPESAACESLLTHDPDWVTAEHTRVEARRNLARLLAGDELADVVVQFEADWARMRVVPLSSDVCSAAASVALQTGARTLDALHVAAALEVAPVSVVPYDRRLAAAASSMGLEVLEP